MPATGDIKAYCASFTCMITAGIPSTFTQFDVLKPNSIGCIRIVEHAESPIIDRAVSSSQHEFQLSKIPGGTFQVPEM